MPDPTRLYRVYQQLDQVHLEIARLAARVEALHLPQGQQYMAEARNHGGEFARTMLLAHGQTWENEADSTVALYQVADAGAGALQHQLMRVLDALLLGLEAALD